MASNLPLTATKSALLPRPQGFFLLEMLFATSWDGFLASMLVHSIEEFGEWGGANPFSRGVLPYRGKGGSW